MDCGYAQRSIRVISAAYLPAGSRGVKDAGTDTVIDITRRKLNGQHSFSIDGSYCGFLDGHDPYYGHAKVFWVQFTHNGAVHERFAPEGTGMSFP